MGGNEKPFRGYFYPRSPCGERQRAEHHANSQQEFLSTLSLRRATRRHRGNDRRPVNFYPRSPCGERRNESSEHTDNGNFYPRSPCGERRDVIAVMTDAQSISIHALLAESDWPGLLARPFFIISIHALLAESDRLFASSGVDFAISIHALLAESDAAHPDRLETAVYHFYPRSPCGERLLVIRFPIPRKLFLSTLSLRRATETAHERANRFAFLSTLSLRRATPSENVKSSP